MAPWYTDEQRADFIKGALTYLARTRRSHQARAGASRRSLRQSSLADLQPPLHPRAAEDHRRADRTRQSQHDRHRRRRPQRTLRPGVELRRAVLCDSISHGSRRLGLRRTEDIAASTNGRSPRSTRPSRSPPTASCSRLHDEYQVVPGNCDYELADSLFKSGRAAMIINGDWSWTDYLTNPDIDAAVAVLADRQFHRQADGADDHAQGLLAQRQRDARRIGRRDGVRPLHDQPRRAASGSSDELRMIPTRRSVFEQVARLDRPDVSACRKSRSTARD